MELSQLNKVKLDTHLTILRSLATPELPYGDIDVQQFMTTMSNKT